MLGLLPVSGQSSAPKGAAAANIPDLLSLDQGRPPPPPYVPSAGEGQGAKAIPAASQVSCGLD